MKKIIIAASILFVSTISFASPEVETEKAESQKFIDKESKVAKTEKTLSGILYRPTKTGKGPNPKPTDVVTVDYKGTLRTGETFDASPKGKPISFALNQVVPCWTEALQKMQAGGSAVIVCPSHLAYGDEGTGSKIKGGAALKFEVTLHKIAPF